jgi:hypothetical protein
METDETGAESDYNPLESLVSDEFTISEELLVETIDLIFNDPSLRNINAFSFALLKKFGISSTAIRNFFPNIGLQREQTCRENLIKLKDSNFEIQSGGKYDPLQKTLFFKNII